MSDETQVVGRRGVLRGGAIAAGVAAGAVIAGASAQTASAADTPVLLGAENSGAKTTGITITGSTADPALKLTNTTGPSLQLTPVTTVPKGNLALGNIVNTADGPYIGISDGPTGTMTTTLVTGNDLVENLNEVPIPVPQTPLRVLDTRRNLDYVVDASPNPFDSAGRLKDGAWLDIAVGDASGDATVQAAFLNVTVTGPLTSGFVTLCPSPQNRPASSTINFSKDQTIANGAFIGAGVVAGAFAVRVYARATTHVLLDLTGAVLTAVPGPAAGAAMKARSNSKLRASARLNRVNRPKKR